MRSFVRDLRLCLLLGAGCGLLFWVAGCRPGMRSSPPGGSMLTTTTAGMNIQFLQWKEGLAILLVDNVPGSHFSGGGGSSTNPAYTANGSAGDSDNLRYNWRLETTDGKAATFQIDGKEYDLAKGTLFVIKNAGDKVEIHQLSRDLSAIPFDVEGVKKPIENDTEIRKILSGDEAKPPAAEPVRVSRIRVPNGGIQPQAVADAQGNLHLTYFKGDKANAGDLFYVRRDAGKETFSEPIRINSKPGSACATGTVRGGQICLGKKGRVHVVWNGVGSDYARLNDAGTAFEEQRNLMRQTNHADGGCTVAADDAGNVYVVWHGHLKGDDGDAKRQVWVARSTDDGKTFSTEEPVWKEPTGVCACCSTRAFADHKGAIYLLYRSATAEVNRDIYLLASEDKGKSFQQLLVHKWKVPG